jgi:hypothetical protein
MPEGYRYRAPPVLSQAGAPLSWTSERVASLVNRWDFGMCWLQANEEGSG